MSSESDELVLAPAVEIARRIRSRSLSPVEVVDAFLNRIDEKNDAINAFVTVLADEARAIARTAANEVATGNLRGPLHGVPIAIKDLYDFKAGAPNTFGVKEFADYVPERTAGHIARLEQLGAIVLGKTNTPEFGHKGTTDNRLFGPTSTPFALGSNSGGSSGGSAAAVAAGMCAFAQGSDGGGSVRIPAAMCGVVGLKPTYGLVANVMRPNAFNTTDPFVGNGPLARSVEDCALLLDAMVGYEERDPGSVPVARERYSDAILARVAGWRVAYLPTLGGFPVAADVRAVIDHAVRALAVAGVHIDLADFTLPAPHREVTDLWLRLTGSRMVSLIEMFADAGLDLRADAWENLPPQLRAIADRGAALTTAQYRRDQFLRTAIVDSISDVLDSYDAIVTPTLAVSSVTNTDNGWTVGPDSVDGESVDPLLGWCLTHPFNYTGHPAISVPGGMTPKGFPVGLQIVGRRFRDNTVLSLAAAYERIRPWQHTYARLLA